MFIDSNKIIYQDDDPVYRAAKKQIAEDVREVAYAIRKEDLYASHVTEDEKDVYLKQKLSFADKIEKGHAEIYSFWLWQKINTILTGACIGFLPKLEQKKEL